VKQAIASDGFGTGEPKCLEGWHKLPRKFSAQGRSWGRHWDA